MLITAAWPGPLMLTGPFRDDNPLRHSMHRLLALLPSGHWTTYGDLAKVLGTAAQPLGSRLATVPAPNAHRVLTSQGEVSAAFRWVEHDRTDDPRQLFEREGIRSAAGRADPAQRLSVDDLALLRETAEDDSDAVNCVRTDIMEP